MLAIDMWSNFFRNLRSGCKLLACLRLHHGDLRVSLPQVLYLAAIAAALFLLREKLIAQPGAVFVPWNLPQLAWVILGILIAVALTSLVQASAPLALLTAVAAMAPWLVALIWLVQDVLLVRWPGHEQLWGTVILIIVAVALTRAIVMTAQRRRI